MNGHLQGGLKKGVGLHGMGPAWSRP
jgi:hypothetical protein